MFGWMTLEAQWATEQAYQALEVLKEHRIPTRMPSDDMFFTSAFHLPHPDLRWQIQVRRRDRDKAVALLAWEGLMKESQGATGMERDRGSAVLCGRVFMNKKVCAQKGRIATSVPLGPPRNDMWGIASDGVTPIRTDCRVGPFGTSPQ